MGEVVKLSSRRMLRGSPAEAQVDRGPEYAEAQAIVASLSQQELDVAAADREFFLGNGDYVLTVIAHTKQLIEHLTVALSGVSPGHSLAVIGSPVMRVPFMELCERMMQSAQQDWDERPHAFTLLACAFIGRMSRLLALGEI